MTRVKTIVGYLALFLSLAGIATGIYAIFFANPAAVKAGEVEKLLKPVVEHIRSDGITPDLNEYLAAAGPKPKNWLATVVFRKTELDEVLVTGQAVAASDPILVGLDMQETYNRLSRFEETQGSVMSISYPVTISESGVSYPIPTWDGATYFVAAYSISPPAYSVGVASSYPVIVAWLAIAAWIAMDVRERQEGNAIAWALLGLVAGPVALGVWLIYRAGQSKPEPVLCPSCGSNIPSNAAYCVRCGHPVVALCPKCGGRVDLEWAYCASCGASLSEESSNP